MLHIITCQKNISTFPSVFKNFSMVKNINNQSMIVSRYDIRYLRLLGNLGQLIHRLKPINNGNKINKIQQLPNTKNSKNTPKPIKQKLAKIFLIAIYSQTICINCIYHHVELKSVLFRCYWRRK